MNPTTQKHISRLRMLYLLPEMSRSHNNKRDGHWVYQLEADCTIPAEYILMNHFADEIDDKLELKIAVYLREHPGK